MAGDRLAGLVHAPVTPFTRAGRVDFEVYGRLIEFHLRHGADALALPMHAGESVSLTETERRALIEHAVKQVRGRVPIVVHVSDAGTGIAAAHARHAEAVERPQSSQRPPITGRRRRRWCWSISRRSRRR